VRVGIEVLVAQRSRHEAGLVARPLRDEDLNPHPHPFP